MSSFFTLNRIIAVVVLVGAGAWVATGKFAAVGSEEAKAADTVATTPEPAPEAPAVLRTVGAVVPVFADFAREIRIAGATEADKTAVLAARSDGIVSELHVAQGQTVEAGALVLRLEGSDVEAGVRTAQASLAKAVQSLEVGETLFAKGSLPVLELTSRRAEKSAAEAALSQAQAAADRLTLNAPFSGSMDTVAIEVGEWVQAGAAIGTLLSLDPIVIKAEVSERDVANVQIGSHAKVRLVDGTELEGTVRHLSKQASEKTRTFLIDVALPNPDGGIPAGMTAEVSLFAPPQSAVTVPRSILTMSPEGVIGLRVVDAGNIAHFAPVEIIEDGEKGLVVAGVPKDMRIIVAGQDLIRDGDTVVVTEISAETAAEVMK
jgi:multidrug efflux system membrane fusion protein